jgi:hypothetical protein
LGEGGVTHTHAAAADANAFRRDVIAAFTPSPAAADAAAAAAAASEGYYSYVGINFHRTEIGELGGGHMSPVGAYDASTDRVLVMDVSRYKYPPVWTSLVSAYRAMNTTDGASGKSRGWVVIGGGGGGGGAGGGGAVAPNAAGEGLSAAAVEARRETRAACMSAAGAADWDAVMGCMRWPPVVLVATGGGGGGGGGVSVGAAVLAALACAVAGGAGVGGAWYYAESQREAKFRRHVVMAGDFGDM